VTNVQVLRWTRQFDRLHSYVLAIVAQLAIVFNGLANAYTVVLKRYLVNRNHGLNALTKGYLRLRGNLLPSFKRY